MDNVKKEIYSYHFRDGYLREKVHRTGISSTMLKKLYPKLKKIHGLEAEEIDSLLEDLSAFALFTPEELKLTDVPGDPSDEYLICAVEGKAEYIISGDHHLLDLGKWEGIKIVTPKEFLELL